MARIFISYSRADHLFIGELVPLLEQVFNEHEIWYDQHITGSEDWWQRILREINASDLFIYLISNDSLHSEYCQAEFREALRLQKLCLPVIVRPKTEVNQAPPDLLPEIKRRNWIDMSGGFKDHRANAKLYAAINQHLRNIPQKPPTPLSAGPVSKPEVTLAVKKPRPALTTNQVAIIVALIGVIGTLGAALITNLSNRPGTNGGTTEVAQSTSEVPALQTTATYTSAITNTPTPGVTATPTPDPVEAALARARTFNGTNEDWKSQQFIHTFADDPAKAMDAQMMLVPLGTFMMGSENGFSDEKPVHAQTITEPFWIDRTEVTRAQYQLCIDAGACSETPDSEYSTRGTQPINRVTWFQARDYCVWRGMRLPTEVEWEYAARGPDGWEYPWGDEWNADNAVGSQYSNSQTADVGSRPQGASWVGALDMSGNVWEWLSSLYLNYPYEANHENVDDTNSTRVLRGGSFLIVNLSDLRASNRLRFLPPFEYDYIGFRCVRL